jgi:hypothetical protein
MLQAHSNLPHPFSDAVISWTSAWRGYLASNATPAVPGALVHLRLGAMQGTRGNGPGLQLTLHDRELSKAVAPLNFVSLSNALAQHSRFDSIVDGIHTDVNSTITLEVVSRLLAHVCFGSHVPGR